MEFIYVDQWGNVDTGNTVGDTELKQRDFCHVLIKIRKI